MGLFSRESLKGKVVVITGASSGIGEALALDVAARGADVALLARRTDRLSDLAQRLKTLGVRALPVTCDVTKTDDVNAAMHEVEKSLGRIDWVFANAGFGVVGPLRKLKIEDYQRQFDTNVFGVLRTVKASLSAVEKTKGLIAIMGSVAGYVSTQESSPYSMSKFAVRALADALRLECDVNGVHVMYIAPGFVDSEIQQVDNRGVHKDDRKRSVVPRTFVMPAPTAAKQMVRAALARRPEVIVTYHAQVLIFIARHLPALGRFIARSVVRSTKKARIRASE